MCACIVAKCVPACILTYGLATINNMCHSPSPHPHRSHTLRPGPSRLPELPDTASHLTPPREIKTLPNFVQPLPPAEDSETDYSDMEDDDDKFIPVQNRGNRSSPLKSPSGSSIPVVAETNVSAVATKGSPVMNGACTDQNGTRNSGTETTESPVTLPKSSGSGAIAQHLKNILSKRSPEKEPLKTASKAIESEEIAPISKASISDSNDDFIMVSSHSSIRSTVSSVSEVSTTTDIESSVDTTTPLTSPTTTAAPPSKVGKIRWAPLGQKDDIIDDEEAKGYTMRSRTHTLAALHSRGKKPMERGRRRLKDIKKEETKKQPKIKRQSSLTNLTTLEVDYELISPEIVNWVNTKIFRDLEKKYGGSEKANKAAAKIQRVYREYKMQSRFQEIRREKHLRNRAQSMRTPARRPSILSKNRPMKYHREHSTPDTRDPLLKAREASKLLSKERVGHTHSGTRLQLAQAKRKESQGMLHLGEIVLEECELEVMYRAGNVRWVKFSFSGHESVFSWSYFHCTAVCNEFATLYNYALSTSS